jgi:hypothetical protein
VPTATKIEKSLATHNLLADLIEREPFSSLEPCTALASRHRTLASGDVDAGSRLDYA